MQRGQRRRGIQRAGHPAGKIFGCLRHRFRLVADHRPAVRTNPFLQSKKLRFESLETRHLLSASPIPHPVSVFWSGSLGGSEYDEVRAVALDPEGNLIAVGTSFSSGWVTGGHDTTWGGDGDAFVLKLSPEGQPLWSTYLGGELDDGASGVAVDSEGNIYVAGWTRSTGWISGGYDTSYGGFGDGFVVKLNAAGNFLWGTYLGGNDWDSVSAIALEASDELIVAGTTSSSGWVHGGFDVSYNGGTFDAFAAKLTPEGQLRWSTYLGGVDRDFGNAVTVNPGGIYIVGKTSSSNWMANGADLTYGGWYDGFLVKLTSNGQRVWSTYLGGTGEDTALAITALADTLYVAGQTASADWPSVNPVLGPQGGRDGFVVAVQADGGILGGTHLGGTGDDGALSILGSINDILLVAGSTTVSDWLDGRILAQPGGGQEGFLVQLSLTGDILKADGLGGEADDFAAALSSDGVYTLVAAGNTSSAPDWPGNVLIGTPGGLDGFLLLASLNSPPTLERLVPESPIVLRGTPFRLRAEGIADADGLATVVGASLYLDENANGVWDPEDILLAETTVSAMGEATWELSGNPFDTWPLGPRRFFAVVRDEAGTASEPVTAEVLFTKRVDLGTVDYLRFEEAEIQGEQIFYQLIPRHDARLLAIASIPSGTAPIRLALYEHDPLLTPGVTPLATAELTPELPRTEFPPVFAGSTYYLVLESSGSSAAGVALTLANLFSWDALRGVATAFGTSMDDRVEVSFGESPENPSTFVTVNGVLYEFAPPAGLLAQLVVVAGEGYDIFTVRDSPQDDAAWLWPDRVVFHRAANTETGPSVPQLEGEVVGWQFEEVHIYGGRNDHDTAWLYDSLWETSTDTAARLKFEPALGQLKWITPSSYIRLKFFEEAHVFAGQVNDRALFYDDQESDVFEGQLGLSRRRGPAYEVWAHGFASVVAYSEGGGDRATLIDSVLKDELQFKPHKTELFDQLTGGSVYRITLRGFSFIETAVNSVVGKDKAALWDSLFDEWITATPQELIFARLVAGVPQPLLTLRGFELIKVRDSSGGDDRATLRGPLAYELVFGRGWNIFEE